MRTDTKYSLACGRYGPIQTALDQQNVNYLTIGESRVLPVSVASHADMLVYNAGKGRILTYDGYLQRLLSDAGYDCRIPQERLGSTYPNDVKLNCLRICDALIANTRYCARKVLECAEEDRLRIFHVKQGYAKCSTATVGDSAAITADKGIAEALKKAGADVLLISPGHIDIPQYDYGFIGGCCVQFAPDKLMFAGNVLEHPDGRKIIEFAEKHGAEVICADLGPNKGLYDFGGAVSLE